MHSFSAISTSTPKTVTMCKETKQKYSSCYCYAILYDICAQHIDHTRMQIDNDPCPGLIYMSTESARGCGHMECVEKVNRFYTFENNGARRLEDRKKSRELKEREKRQKREREERERKLTEREERDRLFWEGKRKKKMKKEKLEEPGEVDVKRIQPWLGGVQEGDADMDV